MNQEFHFVKGGRHMASPVGVFHVNDSAQRPVDSTKKTQLT
jgi:hypothetical protein